MTKYLNIAKGAVLTATAVLIVIYIARKAPVVGPIAGPLVNKALMG